MLTRPSLPSTENNEHTFLSRLLNSATKTVHFFEEQLNEDGSYKDNEAKDIACYYKAPIMFITAKKEDTARKMLSFLEKKFMSTAGDFRTSPQCKSVKTEYSEYWSYINGWIFRAASKLNMNDISQLTFIYLMQSYQENYGFVTNPENSSIDKSSDVLTTAHMGLLNLESHNVDLAITAGEYLCKAIENQPNIQAGFYLRFNEAKEPITQFSADKEAFFFINCVLPEQLYFMIGYPAAFLAILYKKTSNNQFLNAAETYFNFALSCNENIYQCNFSHKIAWAASLLYNITGSEKYFEVIEKITTHFINTQSNTGLWHEQIDKTTAYDQSAEIACWFLDIANNINTLKKKVSLSEPSDMIEPLFEKQIPSPLNTFGLYSSDKNRSQFETVSGKEKVVRFKTFPI